MFSTTGTLSCDNNLMVPNLQIKGIESSRNSNLGRASRLEVVDMVATQKASETPRTGFDMSMGQCPYVAQEVCVIERTIRQEPLGANSFNFGLQGTNQMRSDLGNSLLALVSGSQHQVRSNFQPSPSSHPPFVASHPQLYQMSPGNFPVHGGWSVHPSSLPSGGCGTGSTPARNPPQNMLGREMNGSQYARVAGGQDNLESTFLRASGLEMLKHNISNATHETAIDPNLQGPFPQWLTDIVSRRHGLQNVQQGSPLFASGTGLRRPDLSQDVGPAVSSLPADSSTLRARVFCTNYDTSQSIVGDLCLTEMGRLGVLCSCHGVHMSVTKFTRHVGLFSPSPGSCVYLEGGESLVQWRRLFFSQCGVRVPEDEEGWEWTEAEPCEGGSSKYKAVVTQSWQKEVDVSYGGEPVLKSRVTQVWDTALSPGTPAAFQSGQTHSNIGLPSNTGHNTLPDSREAVMKSFGRAFKGNTGMDFGSCPPTLENLQENHSRLQGSSASGMHSFRNTSQVGASPAGEYVDFFSHGSQHYVSAVQRQVAMGSKSLLKEAWNDVRDTLPQEKDSSLSSFELRLGQPSQQSQVVAASFGSSLGESSIARHRLLYERVLQTVIDSRRQQVVHSTGAHAFPGNPGHASERKMNNQQQSFERSSYVESSRLDGPSTDPSRGVEGNVSVLVDHASPFQKLSKADDAADCQFSDELKDREKMLNGDGTQLPAEEFWRWSSCGNGGRGFKSGDVYEQLSKQWESQLQRQMLGTPVDERLCPQGGQDLDTIVDQGWLCKGRSSQHENGRERMVYEREGARYDDADRYHKETRGCDKEGLPCLETEVSRGHRDVQACACLSCGKPSPRKVADCAHDRECLSTVEIEERSHRDAQSCVCMSSSPAGTKGRAGPRLGDYVLACSKGKDMESMPGDCASLKISKDSTQELSAQNCGSPIVRRLKSFQALTSQGCVCGHATDERLKGGNQAVALACDSAVLSAEGKRAENAEKGTGKSGLRDSNCEAFHWKEVGGIFLAGGESLADATYGEFLSPGGPLEEDVLAPTAGKGIPQVVPVSKVQSEQQPLSDVCSKSSENDLSGFSDGGVVDVGASPAESTGKTLLRSEVVDEGSGIGKCCSSDGVEMGPGSNDKLSFKDSEMQKEESPSSRKCPLFSKTTGPVIKVPSRTRGHGHYMIEPVLRRVEVEVLGSEGNQVEKKRRRAMKWKRLDAAIGVAEAKRHKGPVSANLAKEEELPQQPAAVSPQNVKSSPLNNVVEVSLSLSGRVTPLRIRQLLKPHEQGKEIKANMTKDKTDGDQKRNSGSLDIGFPQEVKQKKSKRSGHLKPDHPISPAIEIPVRRPSSDVPGDIPTSKTNVPRTGIEESLAVTSTVPSLSLNFKEVRAVRTPIGLPSPRHGRMVSLSSIMKLPEDRSISANKERLKGPCKEKTVVKVSNKLDSGTVNLDLLPTIQSKEVARICKAQKKSKSIIKENKCEAQKIRSLLEITNKRKLPGPGAGALEFTEEGRGASSGSFKGGLSVHFSVPPESGLQVANHLSLRETTVIIPRGERSPRGNSLKKRNTIWQQTKVGRTNAVIEAEGQVLGEKLLPQTLVSDGCSQERAQKSSGRKLQASVNRSRIPLQVGNNLSGYQVAPPGKQASSNIVLEREQQMTSILQDAGTAGVKRVAQLEGIRSTSKKQKLVDGTRQPVPVYSFEKVDRQAASTLVPVSIVADPIHYEDVLDLTTKCQAEEAHESTPRRKRPRRSRPDSRNRFLEISDCCVCGSSLSEVFNQLVSCGHCLIKVHQACYGVKKIPVGQWLCRTCKAGAKNPVCVLCGYGGGAMTRAQKTSGFVKSLMKAWGDTPSMKEKGVTLNFDSTKGSDGMENVSLPTSSEQVLVRLQEHSGKHFSKSNIEKLFRHSVVTSSNFTCNPVLAGNPIKTNTVTSAMADAKVTQWVHMVCALWMPGTRCLNFGTMGAFDVSGVAPARRRLICSMCKRKGGSCIQCRIAKCAIPFHAWCAHEKGLLQSETVEDGSEKVGFFGKCLRHGRGIMPLTETRPETLGTALEAPDFSNEETSCARTEGYKGRMTLEQRAHCRKHPATGSSMAVSPEQVSAWLRINERRSCKARRFIKPANSDLRTDHREYLRFKQEQGWRRLAVYKSGIHALGLYTTELICRDEMVVEYIGEIVGLRVADKREADYHSGRHMQYQGACYLFRIDKERIIDATRKGGIARFVNHSCSPNCVAKVICVQNQNKVVFFAQRDIFAREEITYDYQFNFEQDGDKIPCFCGSASCRGSLN